MDSAKKTKVALYARVSTLLAQDPEIQLIQLRQVAQSRGFIIVEEFVDRGISGAKESRPALNKLMKAAMAGSFSFVLVTALDRIGRDTRHILALMDSFKGCRVSLISLREGLDFSTSTGQLVLTILSAVAQLERSLISERIKNSLAAKKLAAAQTGSSWKCGRPSKLTPALAAEIRRLREEGLSIRQIARRLSIAKTTVLRAVHNHVANGSGSGGNNQE